MFQPLETDWYLGDVSFSDFEEAAYHMMADADEVQYEMFKGVYEKKGMIQDLSMLPLWKLALKLHGKRANY